ncbi:MAG: hypothetical protein ACREMY_05005 [bacterium]
MSLKDRLDIESESWRPDLGEHDTYLIGIVADTGEFQTDYGMAPTVTVRDEAGNYWRWSVLGEVAQKRIGRLQPAVGDEIGVKYLGRRPSPTRTVKDGSPVLYADWRIVLEKSSAAAEVTRQPSLAETADEPF